jgi:hypothetical protein
MRSIAIMGLIVLVIVIGAGLAQHWIVPARAGAPVVRATYQGIVAGVNDNVAAIWLLGNDGTLKICTQVLTNTNPNAPVCSAAVTP